MDFLNLLWINGIQSSSKTWLSIGMIMYFFIVLVRHKFLSFLFSVLYSVFCGYIMEMWLPMIAHTYNVQIVAQCRCYFVSIINKLGSVICNLPAVCNPWNMYQCILKTVGPIKTYN